jgi:hypothetical protein
VLTTDKKGLAISLLAPAVCLLFALLWWNRFLGVTNEGWHFFFAHQIVHGKIPYRDFYLFVPPLLQLEMAATIEFFGEHLIVTQVVGLIEAGILALVLYRWLARVFPASDAFLASATGIIICMANRTEELHALHMSAIFHTTLAGAVATLAVDARGVRTSYAFWGGLLAGLALLIKQTSGVAAVVSLPLMLALAAHQFYGWKEAWRAFSAFTAGCAIPLAMVSVWLAAHGALGAAVSDVFLRGPSSKGSALLMLSRFWIFLREDTYFRRHAFFAVFLFASLLILCRKTVSTFSQNRFVDYGGVLALATLTVASILLGWALSFSASVHLPGTFVELPQHVAAFLAEIGSFVFFWLYLWLLLTDRLDRKQIQFFAIAGFSCAVALLSSLSIPTSVGTIVPAFSFVLAAFLTGLRNVTGAKLLRPLAIFLSLLFVAQLSWQKCASPYFWRGWKEADIHRANVTLKYPELHGYHVSPQTAAFVTRVTDEIDAHSGGSQPIFVYPHIPIFYLLSHRQPESFAYVHFIDVAPEFVYATDAAILSKNPPAVIVLFKPTDQELRRDEMYYRSGQRTSQRDLLAAVAEIRTRCRFQDSIFLPDTGQTVEILALR